MSLGEEKIAKLLKNNSVNFKREQELPGLKWKKNLRFDFSIYDSNNEILCFIEFDGEQHFKEVKHWGGYSGLQKRMELDRVKNSYCLLHNIPLIRIPYYELDDLTFEKIFQESKYRVISKWHNDFIRKSLIK